VHEGPDGRLRGDLHIVTDIAKFKRFDDEFQAGTHCIELADGTRAWQSAEVFLMDSRVGRWPSDPQDIFSVRAAADSGATVTFKKGEDIVVHKDGTQCPIMDMIDYITCIQYLMDVTTELRDVMI